MDLKHSDGEYSTEKNYEYYDIEYLIDENDDIRADEINPPQQSATGGRKRTFRRTEEQLELLIANAPPKQLQHKVKAEKWKVLTKRLNEIGPPVHEWNKWRKMHTEHINKTKVTSDGSK